MVSLTPVLRAPARLPLGARNALEEIGEAIKGLPALEKLLAHHLGSLEQQLTLVLGDSTSLRDDVRQVHRTVEAQQDHLARIETRLQTLDRHAASLDSSLEHLDKLGEEARDRLPDPEAGQGPVARAREVLTGK